MNKIRRKQLAAIQSKIAELQELLEELHDEEQEAIDNMPESLWGSDRYEAMEEAASNIELAIDELGYAADYIEEACA